MVVLVGAHSRVSCSLGSLHKSIRVAEEVLAYRRVSGALGINCFTAVDVRAWDSCRSRRSRTLMAARTTTTLLLVRRRKHLGAFFFTTAWYSFTFTYRQDGVDEGGACAAQAKLPHPDTEGESARQSEAQQRAGQEARRMVVDTDSRVLFPAGKGSHSARGVFEQQLTIHHRCYATFRWVRRHMCSWKTIRKGRWTRLIHRNAFPWTPNRCTASRTWFC